MVQVEVAPGRVLSKKVIQEIEDILVLDSITQQLGSSIQATIEKEKVSLRRQENYRHSWELRYTREESLDNGRSYQRIPNDTLNEYRYSI